MILAQISALKSAWTLAALIGVIITFALLYMSITEYRLLKERNLNGWRKQVAKTSILIYFGGFMTQVIYLTTGILALTQSNTSGSSVQIRHITQALFLSGAVSAIILAIVIFYRRLHILKIIEDALSSKENTEHGDGKD